MTDVSIVIPCRNEAANIPPLLAEIAVAMQGRDYEVIIVDDASTDETTSVLEQVVRDANHSVRHLRHASRSGQSLALRTGAWAANSMIVATIDGDGQNNPEYIPMLVDALIRAGPGTAAAQGQRLKRRDTVLKRWASLFANSLRSAILKDRTRDTGCGLKAIRTDVLRRLPFFDGTHRFIPALVIQEGYGVLHVDVVDRPRLHGKSNYGIVDRGLQGAVDLVGVWWLGRRRRRIPAAMGIEHG